MPDGQTTDTLDFFTIVDALIANREGTTGQIDIVRLVALIAALMGPSYGTRAVLYADLTWPAGAIGYVRADGTPAYNGVYKKAGAAGTGSWTRIGDLPSGAVEAPQLAALEAAVALLAPQLNAIFTGIPQAPTAAPGTNTAQIASTAFVHSEIATLIGGSPELLNTLVEFAAALGNDPNYAATTLALIGTKASQAAVDALTTRVTSVLTTPAGSAAAYTAVSDKLVQGAARYSLQPPVANSGPVTLAVTHPGGTTAALPLRDASGVDFAAGHLRANRVYELRYATTQWLVLNADEADMLSRDAADALDSDLRRLLVGRIDGALSAWTGGQTGDAASATALAASVLSGVADNAPILRLNDLTAVGTIPAGLRDLVAVVPGHTYRISADLRLVGATVLGVDQAQLQHLLLNADYSLNSSAISSPSLDLLAGWGTFVFDWVAPVDTTAAWIRARVFKRSAYTDATGSIQCKRLDVIDVTGGGQIPERLSDIGNRLTSAESRRARILGTTVTAHGLPVPTVQQGRAPILYTSSKWQPLQPRFARAVARSTAIAPKWDLGYLIDGTEATVWVEADAEFWAGRGVTFMGHGGSNRLAVTAPALVILRAYGRPGETRKIHAQVIEGVATWTTSAEPVAERAAVMAGQSNGDRFVKEGGVGGFAEALQDGTWMTAGTVDAAVHWIDGATPGTAILRAHDSPGGSAWWWDDTELDPVEAWGPAMATCLAAINAAVAAGQPVPEAIAWSQGEADVTGLHNGTRTKAQFQAGIVAVWGHIRDHLISLGATAPALLYIGMGAREHAVSAVQRKGASLVRWAYLDAIAATAWAHDGVEAFDVPRGPNEIHYTEMGYWLIGRRLARLWANVILGATYDLGPVMSDIAISADRKILTLSHTSPSRILVMPAGESGGRTLAAAPEAPDGAPMLYTVLDSAGVLQRIVATTVVGSTVQVQLAQPLPANGRVIFPGGFAQEHRRQDFVRDHLYDEASGCPGMPLRSGISAAIA